MVASVGCGSSTTITVNTTTVLSAVSSVLMTQAVNVSTLISASQSLTFTAVGAKISGGVTIDQNMLATINVLTSVTNSLSSQVLTSMQQTLTNNLNNMSTTETQLLSKANSNATDANINSAFSSVLSSSQTLSSVTSVLNTYDFTQTLTINLNGATITGPESITQNMVINLAAQAVISTVVQALTSNTQSAAMANAVTQAASEQNTGAAALISSILSGIEGLFTGPLAWVAIIVVICIIGLAILIAVHHAGKNKTPPPVGYPSPRLTVAATA